MSACIGWCTKSAKQKGANRAKELNWTKLTRFRFWRTDQWASTANLLVIGWRVRERSHVDHWRC